jgi:hypothetical protein
MRRSKPSHRLNEDIRYIIHSHCRANQLSEAMVLSNQPVEQQLLDLSGIPHIKEKAGCRYRIFELMRQSHRSLARAREPVRTDFSARQRAAEFMTSQIARQGIDTQQAGEQRAQMTLITGILESKNVEIHAVIRRCNRDRNLNLLVFHIP